MLPSLSMISAVFTELRNNESLIKEPLINKNIILVNTLLL